jgi:MFS family permease
VLVSFNLVMALAAVPRATGARGRPGRAAAVGLASSPAPGSPAALSDELSTLIAARCVQALGGAAAVTAVLELLPATVGSERARGASGRRAGATGAALGPAVGGLLTELVSWQSIFLLQAPLALAAGGADPRRRPARGGDRDRRAELREPAARTCSPTSPWRWSRRRSRPRSSCSSCC